MNVIQDFRRWNLCWRWPNQSNLAEIQVHSTVLSKKDRTLLIAGLIDKYTGLTKVLERDMEGTSMLHPLIKQFLLGMEAGPVVISRSPNAIYE
mmetsp:Transcript_23854/g.44553  ORF Transcript_23854/g.44553 Transcript_23854/m.44553 type:complete len:93 (+) Transcript_23854:581-859(+)